MTKKMDKKIIVSKNYRNPDRKYWTNNKWALEVASRVWTECPKCKNKSKNFIIKEYDDFIGTGVIIECSDCGYHEDITPYEMW